jgi:hypothetical protein
VERDIGTEQYYGFQAATRNCYGGDGLSFIGEGYNWSSSNYSIAQITYSGTATAMDGGTSYLTGSFENVIWQSGILGCHSQNEIVSGTSEMDVRPSVLDVTANGATRVTQVVGNTNIFHFVTPKGAANSQVTLSTTIQYSDIHVPNDIEWEGAVESPNNPFQATLSKDTALRHTVRIKYKGTVLKELRVWVVWATITSTPSGASIFSGTSGDPPGPSVGTKVRFDFEHTIQPAEIITDPNKPDFGGARVNPPPGGNHPINGSPLSSGADKKWDNSRQIRYKNLNPNNINVKDTAFHQRSSYPPDLLNYPVGNVEGNDDATQVRETNDPYSDNGKLTGWDEPVFGMVHRGGVDGDTFEQRLHFREFTRLEIEGVWHRISDFYPWRVHFKYVKVNGLWDASSSSWAQDNSGF